MKMNWDYIAGFFDGEGCVSTMSFAWRPTATTVCIAQSGEEGRAILTAIRDFMWAVGIKSYLGSPQNMHKRTRPMHYLKISARPSVSLFLEHMLPRVSVKRVITQDTLRFFKAFPSTRGAVTTERNRSRGKFGAVGLDRDQLLLDLAELGTKKAVAAKYGVSDYTIHKYLNPEYRVKYDTYRREWRARKKAELIARRVA